MNLPPDRATNLAVWAALWAVLLAWEAVTARSPRLPSVAVVVQLLRRRPVTQLALLAAWGWLGWHLFVRTTF